MEGGRTYLGRSAACHGIVTGEEAIPRDRVAEGSKGRITPKPGGRPERKGSGEYITRSQERVTAEKPIWGLPDSSSEAPRGVYEGTESFPGDGLYRKPGYSHLAQPAEPPYADPHVRWCGRGGRAIVPPIPIVTFGLHES